MKTTAQFLIIIAAIALSVSACKSKKDATSKTPPTTTVNDTNSTYRLWVSFYSKGEGIDLKTKEEFNELIMAQEKKLAVELTPWGREGEVDYCLKLNELNSSEQSDFVKKAKELLAKSSLVHVEENKKCVHKQ